MNKRVTFVIDDKRWEKTCKEAKRLKISKSAYIRQAMDSFEDGESLQNEQIKEIRDLTLKLKIAISKLNEGGVGGIL